MPEQITNDQLRLSDIPEASSDWDTIQSFALTFDGFEAHGSFEHCALIANEERNESLTDLRTCLFFEQRRWRHYGDDPDDEAMVYIRSLIDQIRMKVAAKSIQG